MRHFRIKETIQGESARYIIQYTVRFLFIRYWKKFNKLPFKKYEDALLEIKKVIDVEKDYTKTKKDKTINYHYIDAFRLNRTSNRISSGGGGSRNVKRDKLNKNRVNKSTFIPKEEK